MNQTSPSEPARAHVWVTGRVQNVGFRAFVLECGSRAGLTGWVRNVGYDQVETVAEGPRAKVEQFIQDVRTGPRASHVDEARVEWETPTGETGYFDVKHSL